MVRDAVAIEHAGVDPGAQVPGAFGLCFEAEQPDMLALAQEKGRLPGLGSFWLNRRLIHNLGLSKITASTRLCPTELASETAAASTLLPGVEMGETGDYPPPSLVSAVRAAALEMNVMEIVWRAWGKQSYYWLSDHMSLGRAGTRPLAASGDHFIAAAAVHPPLRSKSILVQKASACTTDAEYLCCRAVGIGEPGPSQADSFTIP